MTTLSEPSRELVSRISREIDFKDRLIGSNLHERAGVKTISLYSLHELYMLLNKPYPQAHVCYPVIQFIDNVFLYKIIFALKLCHAQEGWPTNIQRIHVASYAMKPWPITTSPSNKTSPCPGVMSRCGWHSIS